MDYDCHAILLKITVISREIIMEPNVRWTFVKTCNNIQPTFKSSPKHSSKSSGIYHTDFIFYSGLSLNVWWSPMNRKRSCTKILILFIKQIEIFVQFTELGPLLCGDCKMQLLVPKLWLKFSHILLSKKSAMQFLCKNYHYTFWECVSTWPSNRCQQISLARWNLYLPRTSRQSLTTNPLYNLSWFKVSIGVIL